MEGGAAESQEKSSPTSHAEGASVGKTTEDLYSVYLHGISQRSPQPQQQQQQQQQQQRLDLAATYNYQAYSNSILLHAVTNNAVNRQNFARGYVLPEPFYCFGFQQHPSLRHRALIGNLRGHALPALPSRGLRIEGIPNANYVSAGGGAGMHVGESSAQGAARHKRRMISQGNVNFRGENLMAFHTSAERYTVYDNKYEEIGLARDPHIRAFLANGNYHVGGSKPNT